MKKVKEANFGELISWLNITGWDKGLKILETHLLKTEWLQAHLYGEGDPKSIKAANKLSETIIKQQIALGRLRNMRLNNEQEVQASVATESDSSNEADKQNQTP